MTEQNPYRQRGQSTNRRFLRMASEVLALASIALNWMATQYAADDDALFAPFLNGRIIAHRLPAIRLVLVAALCRAMACGLAITSSGEAVSTS